ncbi:hypothetical protein GE09DRAFT_1105919 [Coniochaeta sp. 2T2.1]|nr:hypothetical protein GE09DRAFT_1105919 [Coniochaeta sp. 2T2.1]
MLLNDDGSTAVREDYYWSQRQKGVLPRDPVEVDEEIFAKLDSARVTWTEVNDHGRSLLHYVAANPTARAAWRCAFLFGKGVDPSVRDRDGRTAGDTAVAFRNKAVVECLDRHNREP